MNLMQKFLLILTMLLLLAGNALQAQVGVLKIAPLKLSYKTLSLSYEHAITKEWTASLGTGFFLTTDFNRGLANSISGLDSTDRLSPGSILVSGFTLTPAIRYYPGGKAPKGFFLDPFLRFLQYKSAVETVYNGNSEISTVESNLRFRALGAGLAIGYQWIFGERFSLEWHGGLGITGGAISHRGTVIEGDIADNIQAYLDEINAYINEEVPFINRELAIEELESLSFRIPGIVWPVFRSGLTFGVAF